MFWEMDRRSQIFIAGVFLIVVALPGRVAMSGADPQEDGVPLHNPNDAGEGVRFTRDITVTATLEKTEFRQLEPIVVKVEATNVSDGHRWLPTFMNVYLDFKVRVFDDTTGKVMPRTRFYRWEGTCPAMWALRPGAPAVPSHRARLSVWNSSRTLSMI